MKAEVIDVTKRPGATSDKIRIALIFVAMFGLFVIGFGMGCNYKILIRAKPLTTAVSVQCSTKGDQTVAFRYNPSNNSMSCETADYTE